MWMRTLSQTLALAAAFLVCCYSPSSSEASTGLKSAYLGAAVWEDNLNAKQINTQLREHFAEVLTRLESKSASSLLTALTRAEATSKIQWSTAQRQSALLYLAHNRKTQIARLRFYTERGLFPINEGQATSAAPIFVDRRGTHCAVGYLMHVDGKDQEVANVVSADNLVEVMDAELAGLTNWIRTSGLTREEAAMIQPGYPIDLNATFEDLATTTPTVTESGLTLSSATIRGYRFTASLPTSFETDPNAIDAILEQGKLGLETNNVIGPAIRSNLGVLFGMGTNVLEFDFLPPFGQPATPPDNLDDWVYIGSMDALFSAIIGGANVNGNVGIVEIEYELSSIRGDFSQIALTTVGANEVSGEDSALLIRSEIFDAVTNQRLGETSLFTSGVGQAPVGVGSDSISLASDSIRIKTYALVAGEDSNARIHSFFHEFDTTALADLGDVSGDGVVNFLDISPLVSLLTAGGFQGEADINRDGAVSFLDIAPFIGILTGGGNGAGGGGIF